MGKRVQMKLLERIARGWVQMSNHMKDYKYIYRNAISDIQKSIAFDIQNIYEWSADLPVPKSNDDIIPLARLPFESCWMEFTKSGDGKEIDFGILLTEGEMNSQDSILMQMFVRPDQVRYATLALSGFLHYDENNKPGQSGIIDTGMDTTLQKTPIQAFFRPALYAVSFCHCKNVETIPHPRPTALQQSLDKKTNIHVPSFHTIEIHKYMERHIKQSTGGEINKRSQKTHLVRGHFKRYTPDAPLLGKHVGVYFWSQHIAGSEGHILINDYRVHPPTGRHERRCIVK